MSSVTKEPRKKPPVPESLGSLVSKVGQTVCCCVTWQRDNWVLPHAWHHEVTSRTWRDFTSFTNSSSSHVSLHSGMLYFINGPWGEKNSILKPYNYHFSRSQSFAKTHGKKPSTWLSAIFNVCETTFWRKRADAIWSCLSLTISQLCSFSSHRMTSSRLFWHQENPECHKNTWQCGALFALCDNRKNVI